MKKEDLRIGDKITKRDMKVKFISNEADLKKVLRVYNEDLTHSQNRDKDIINVQKPISYITIFERKEDILDEKEKEYLSKVIAPFRNKVSFIKKGETVKRKEFILVEYEDDAYPNTSYFPTFLKGTMYKNMELNKEYTLEELGL